MTTVTTRSRSKPKPLSYGDGSIFQRKSDGRWIVRVRENGTNKHLGSATTRDAACQILDDYKLDRDAGLDPAGRDWSTADWLDYWLSTHEPRYDRKGERIAGVEPPTFEKYEIQIRRHILPFVGKILPTQLVNLSKQPASVVRWTQALHATGVGAFVQAEALQRLSAALDMAVGYDLIARNPADRKRIKRPKLVKPKHVKPSELDLVRLIRAIRGDALEALPWISLGGGFRRGEAAALQWQDVSIFSPHHGIIRAHSRRNRLGRRAQQRLNLDGKLNRERLKNSTEERLVDIGGIMIGILDQHWQQQLADWQAAGDRWQGADYSSGQRTGYLFTNAIGTPLEVDKISKYMARVRSSAGLDIDRFHALRRVFATLLRKSGASDKEIMELGGWSDLKMALYYEDPMASQKKDAAMALDGELRRLLEAAN